MNEFDRYDTLRQQGVDAVNAYRAAKAEGADLAARISMLRTIYGLPLREAKKLSFSEDTGEGYAAQEVKIFSELAEILDHDLGIPG